ncbi:hypothetical protein AB0K49_18405 [Streptomyces decoyicus]|uniref:hypothetical protein n=1 Tax=Streptomyces decoyicus TaxID=249567 RepID=UPI00345D67CB
MVDLASPELPGAQLLGLPEMAERGGIASTLRAYISRGNSEVPQPQAPVGGRDQWPRAVADDWVEARQRASEGIRATMYAGDRDNLTPGAAAVRDRFADDFQYTLWGRPDVRKRWILRQRNETSVREVSDVLAWNVAVSLERILPTDILGPTVEGAVLNDLAESIAARARQEAGKPPETTNRLRGEDCYTRSPKTLPTGSPPPARRALGQQSDQVTQRPFTSGLRWLPLAERRWCPLPQALRRQVHRKC